jgi:trans-aconitate 3-methyltransferase
METMLGFEREVLAPHELPPNRLSRDMYDNLPLPWTISNPVTAFPRERYVRLEWDREGVLSNGETFFGSSEEAPIDDLLKGLGTASMVTRWREANPELAGTEKDALTLYGARLREALGSGQTTLSTGSGTVILLFKKAV